MLSTANKILLLFCLSLSITVTAQVKSEYWDDIDFSDTTLVADKMLTDKLINYFYSFTDADEKAFDSLSMAGMDVVFGKAKVNMRVYEFVLEYLLNGYTAMGRSEVTDYLLNYPQLHEGEITQEEGVRLDSITEPYQRVRVGAKAPDYMGVTIDGKSYSIYESSAKRIILVFWSTDCEYCHDFLKSIRKNLDLKSDYELVTFALSEGQEEVTANVKKMRLPGYHFYDELRWDSKPYLDYHITSTPIVFVLDEEKTIVCKPYDWLELRQWIKTEN